MDNMHMIAMDNRKSRKNGKYIHYINLKWDIKLIMIVELEAGIVK